MNFTRKLIIFCLSLSIFNAFAMDLTSLQDSHDQQHGKNDHSAIDRLHRFADTQMKDIRLVRDGQELSLVEADIERACNTVESAISSVQERDGKFFIDIGRLPGFTSESEDESDDNSENEGDQTIADHHLTNLQRLLAISHTDQIKLREGSLEVTATTQYKENARTFIKDVLSMIIEDEKGNVAIDITKLNQFNGKQPEKKPTLWQKITNPATISFGVLCVVGTWLATKKLGASE